MSDRPSGLYRHLVNGIPYWHWYNSATRTCSVGWSDHVVAMSDKRHLLLKRHPLPLDATPVDTTKWTRTATRRLIRLTLEMVEADRPFLKQPPTKEE